MNRRDEVLDRLKDERSGKVILVSHCLLNENTRYPGGAFRPGPVGELLERFAAQGIGLHQMPCPERRAWGGILRRAMLPFFGAEKTLLYRLRGMLLPLFLLWTRLVYRRIAAQVAREVEDYVRSGFTVVGIVGVGGSPSCGVKSRLEVRRALPVLASTPPDRLVRDRFNEEAIANSVVPGEGLYVRALRRALDRRGLQIPFLEYDLIAEMRGERSSVLSGNGPAP